jgi:hypothetical protein
LTAAPAFRIRLNGEIMMDAEQARKAGAQAFQGGRDRAPALNQEFIRQACATGNVAALLDAYTEGWDIARLAQDAPLPDMPSVRRLREITGG